MDIRNLDQLKGFASFIDFLENPTKYKALIDEAKKVVADYYAACGQFKAVKELQVYEAALKDEYQRKEKDLADAWAVQKQEEKRMQERYDSLHEKYQREEEEQTLRLQDIVKLEEEFKTIQEEKQELQKLRKLLDADKQELAEKQDSLKKKEQALKSVLAA